MEGLPGLVLVWCLIGFSHANFSPTINNRMYNVCEDAPTGAYAFTVDATDNENDPLTYSLTAPNDGFFSIDAATGRVTVIRPLDREDKTTIELGVRVSDPSSGTSAKLTIILNEANDNRPIFKKSSYDITIPENTTVGTTLFRADATDKDTSTGAEVNYSIDEVTPKSGLGLFQISPLGDVQLMKPLNFTSLSSFYQLKINATDGGGKCYYETVNHFSSVVFSFITVEDVPDLDPLFVGVPYVGSVEENSSVGTTVLVVTALDQDKGVADDIIYSIEDSSAEGLFDVLPTTGAITVNKSIDREEIGDSVTLIVKATETQVNVQGVHAIATATVRISIIDLNDNPPEFYRCGAACVKESRFTGEVLEHLLGAVSFNMTVKDPDQMKRVSLRLEGKYSHVFSVQPPITTSDSAVQLQVVEPQLLDYENVTQMVLTVIAEDLDKPSYQSTATVTINIQDANDQSPAFPQGSYRLNVSEHSAEGTELGTLTAVDTDTMDQGNITYSLLPESIRLYFDVRPLTGVVYVKNGTLLDREVRSLYSATLQARDTDNKPGSTVLEITVTDVNDHAPVFNRGAYREFVKEGEPLELKIEATDADDSETENSQIVFGILLSFFSRNFTIDPDTGVLRIVGDLDREAMDPELKGIIELNVTATDKGAPPLSTAVTVTIVVEDVDDNTPVFKNSSYTFYVKEGEKGVFVGSVQAEDSDQEFDRISFSILEGSFGSFIIRSYEDERGGGYLGNITVDPEIELDYESENKVFTLNVEAADLGQHSAEVTVEVFVLDVNDERPVFEPPTVTVTVKEDIAPVEVVGRFTAEDRDGNHSLVYRLESLQCRCNGSTEACGGFVLEPTGEVRLDPEHTLDYELCDQVRMEAQVVDEYTEKGENNSATAGLMVIDIEDVNDNAPQFIVSDSVFVVVSERASKGMPVARVTATDRDSGVNRQIDFKVTGVEFRDTNNQTRPMKALFDAVTTQQKDIYVGIIQTTGKLEKSLKGKYLVAVSATDPGDLYSNTVLEIFAVDESYQVALVFTKSKSYVQANLNKIIGKLMAATLAAVEIASIGDDEAEPSRASVTTVVVAYFIYSNGTVLTSTQVEKMISVPQHSLGLIELGLADIGKAPTVVEPVDTLKYGLLGMVAGLIVVLSVLITSLVCTRRSFKRKLKAAKAMNSASMVTSDNQKSGPVVPGTNKYTMEGANPVLNLNMDAVMHLDLDGGSSDTDKVSLNSLDSSGYMDSHENGVLMNVIEEEEEEEGGPPVYIEPLGAALAQRGPKKGRDNPLLGVSNPAFSTTDL